MAMGKCSAHSSLEVDSKV